MFGGSRGIGAAVARRLATEGAAAHLCEGGRIITIGSNTAVRSYPGSSVYSMTKAVAAMVKVIALELAPRGITVNNIQPGPTRTDMAAEYIDMVTPTIPLKRIGEPEEGSSLTIDGGQAL